MRLSRAHMNVIILLPVALAMREGGGCATTTPTALDKPALEKLLPGNTVKTADGDSYAYVAPDGTLRGLNIPDGGTRGTWRITDNNVLCATWQRPARSSLEACNWVLGVDEKTIDWGGSRLNILQGNPRNL